MGSDEGVKLRPMITKMESTDSGMADRPLIQRFSTKRLWCKFPALKHHGGCQFCGFVQAARCLPRSVLSLVFRTAAGRTGMQTRRRLCNRYTHCDPTSLL